MDNSFEKVKELLDPKKKTDKQFFLDLLDNDKQQAYEKDHLAALLVMLKIRYLADYRKKIKKAKEVIADINEREDFTAENVRLVMRLKEEIASLTAEADTYRCFFEEPYFARMDLVDNVEGYNSYYIGKKGDVNLEIVDWRAPVAKKYYQKSQINFSVHEYHYHTILRRSLRVESGTLLDFKNEYLSLRDYLTEEEIGGRDEEVLFDPYLKQIVSERKEEVRIRDIIRTIQEQQYDVITRPERENLVVQGVAGSGKTMILLHRLSYLLYNNEKLQTRDVLVITPSESFNRFIDELSKVLELESVRTMTLETYFKTLLKGKGIELKTDEKKESEEYLSYLYSETCYRDVQKYVDRVYSNIRGLFASEEVREIIGEIRDKSQRQLTNYTAIKNASVRIRRAVLGEIKENPEGGLRYTKPFREFMNGISAMHDFFTLDFDGEEMSDGGYFTKQLVSFFKSATFVYRYAEKVIEDALSSLDRLKQIVEKEITDLKRYKYRSGGTETLTYADRIERRNQLILEIDRTRDRVSEIGDDNDIFLDFYQVVKGDKTLVAVAATENEIGLARYFYRETIKKYKKKYHMEGLYPSDGYAICMVLTKLGVPLYPHYGFVFIDEGQDISPFEYEIIKKNNPTAAFNLFGDLEQNITPYRGLRRWQDALLVEPYRLTQNYRNVDTIVNFVSETLGVKMDGIGLGGEPIVYLKPRKISSFFTGQNGLKAVIVSEGAREKYDKKSYHEMGKVGSVSKNKINYMTVYESKGLEFTSVVVIEEGMTCREKYIACTRALKRLAIVKEEENS